MKNYLINVDMEGIHGVVGERNKGMDPGIADYHIATENSVKEINAAVKALFEGGADNVYVWDNHGAGDNIDFSKVDPRAKKVVIKNSPLTRLDWAKDLDLTAVLYLGYHAMDGTPGVLAHTYCSSSIQYYKFNGKALGEFDMDCIFSGAPAIFAAADDVCLKQMLDTYPEIETVVTKIAKGRNSAEFIDSDTVVNNIYEGVKRALKKPLVPYKFTFPCTIEARYTRMEFAEDLYLRNKNEFGLDVKYGDDIHILICEIKNETELKMFL